MPLSSEQNLLTLFSDYFLPFRHRHLIWQFAKREMLSRYRGSILGLFWSLATPLLMLGVYTFAFVVVFKARWPGLEQAGGVGFALNLFAGLVVFNLFAEIASRAPNLIVDQANMVKKVIFPLQTLAWSSLMAALLQFLLSLGVLLAVLLLFKGGLSLHLLSLPLVLLAFLPFLLGLIWLISALGVFVRDVAQIMQVFVSLMLFLSPVFYPATMLPEPLRFVIQLNPLTIIITEARAVLIENRWPDFMLLAAYALCALAFAWFGQWWFDRTHKAFADVL